MTFNLQKENELRKIKISDLIPYPSHPFKLYEDRRFDDMVDSIKEYGVMSPIIVRPDFNEKEKWEIIAGHNRVNSAKKAGLDEVPALVRHDLIDKDDEVAVLVVESNLNQRSFKDWLYSERADAIFMYHTAIKKQGKRTDLTNEVQTIQNSRTTSRRSGEKLASDEETAINFGLSARVVSRYLSLHKLEKSLLDRLDDDEFGILIAVEISTLRKEEQEYVDELLSEPEEEYHLDMKRAKMLKKSSEKKSLAKEEIATILKDTEPMEATSKALKMVMDIDTYNRYFPNNPKPKDVVGEIELALKCKKDIEEIMPYIFKEYESLEKPTFDDMANFIKSVKEVLMESLYL